MKEVINLLKKCHLKIPSRLNFVCASYLYFLISTTGKKTLTLASQKIGVNKSQLSRFLSKHTELAYNSLETLGKNVAKSLYGELRPLFQGVPWEVLIIIDSTLHSRSTKHTDNSKVFNHGKGYVVGHQWTNILLVINGNIIPLPPISFYSRKKCNDLGIEYLTEHDKVVDYISRLNLDDYIGFHNPSNVVVLMDSGYDAKKIQEAILLKSWDFISAIQLSRSVCTVLMKKKVKRKNGKIKIKYQYVQVRDLFRTVRKNSSWKSIYLNVSGKMRRYRARELNGYVNGLRDKEVKLVCSERSTGKRRIYLCCSNSEISVTNILKCYQLRWQIEIFHKEVKSYLGFEDLGSHSFESQQSHVYWVYVAYILLQRIKLEKRGGILSRKQLIEKHVKIKEMNSLIQMTTQINGVKKIKKYFETVRSEIKAA